MPEKCYQLFLSGIATPATRKQYEYQLERFLKETKLKDFTALLELDDETRQDMLEKYVLMLKKRDLRKSTIVIALAAIELFFDMNKKLVHKKILRKMASSQADYIPGGEKAYTDEDVRKMLGVTVDLRGRALVHFMASTGSRPASIDDPVLTFKNFRPMPMSCSAVFIYEDSRSHYWGFLTPEATSAILAYRDERIGDGEKVTKDSPIFRADYNGIGKSPVKPLSKDNASQIMRRIVERSKIERIKIGNRYDKALNTAFRKRFDTIVKSTDGINNNLAEKLMGHSVSIPLDNTYMDPEIDRLFNEFVKVISALTVDPTERQKVTIHRLKKEKSDLEEKTLDVGELKNIIKAEQMRVDELEDLLSDLFEQYASKRQKQIEQNPNPKARSDPSLANIGEEP